ncbi:MAG: metal-dependent transcriptional regulator [Clostridiales bacterium]|jgi:DtxR family Mn-dependent transcriptional regulator|nr:metal-dependent transcriptional regulator [Clostridiales bacterium]
MRLTATQIRYLLAIHTLSDDGIVRSADIAGSLGVTKPSVHKMIIQLSKMDLITKEKYSVIRVTESGRFFAQQYFDSFSLIYGFLSKQLNLPQDTAEEGVLAILSSMETEKLKFISLQNHTGV